jgi:type IV secretory pathway TrbD component
MSQNDPMFLFGLTLAVVIDVLLVWIVFGMTGVLIAAVAVHLLVGRIEARRAKAAPGALATTEREAR